MMNQQDKILIHELVIKSLEELISAEEHVLLESIVMRDPRSREYYRKCIDFNCDLCKITDVINGRLEKTLLLQEMALYENIAPKVQLVREQAPPTLIQKLERPKSIHRFSKFSLISFITSAAAILFFILFARFVPTKSENSVAILSNSVHAQWAHTTGQIQTKQHLQIGPMQLLSGYAEIQFESGAIVLIEGPSVVVLEGIDQLYITQGRLTVSAPPSAVGFTVRTPNATVVDYGTEFGVLTYEDGKTETHVFKGEVEVRLGSSERVYHQSMRLKEGQAAGVWGHEIRPLPLREQAFRRYLPSPYELYAMRYHPVAYWTVGGEGPSAYVNTVPESSNRLRCTIRGNVVHVNGPTPAGQGPARALYLDGENTYIELTRDPETITTNDFSYILWLYVDQLKEQTILSNSYGPAHRTRQLFGIDSEGHLIHYMVRQEGGNPTKASLTRSDRPLQAGRWHHVAVTAGAFGYKQLYIDGRKAAAPFEIGTLGAIASSVIGADVVPQGQYERLLCGAISDMAYYDRVLSAQEIKSLYDVGQTTK